MQTAIEQALSPLVGLPFWGAGRASNMEWLQFGERVMAQKGEPRCIGTWALHISCAWRIRDFEKIIVASTDYYMRANHVSPLDEDFDWDVQGHNQHDQRIKSFMEGKEDSLIVVKATANSVGDVFINLNEKFFLEIFADVSTGDLEYWRLFNPSLDLPHFVVTTLGIEA